jgi:hypothetical protein
MCSVDLYYQLQRCYAPLGLHAKRCAISNLLKQQLLSADDFAGKIAQ